MDALPPSLRAARLASVADDEAERIRQEEHAAAAARQHGSWRWRFVGDEVHLRSKALPTIRIDLLRPEAVDLLRALSKALDEKLPKQPRVSKADRKAATGARRKWNKEHEAERRYAIRELAKEFAERGGW